MENISVQLAGKLKRLNNLDKKEMTAEIQQLVEKHNRTLHGKVDLIIKQKKEVVHQVPLFHCKAKLLNSRGIYIAYGHEYGIKQTVNQTLDNMTRQLLKEKVDKIHIR